MMQNWPLNMAKSLRIFVYSSDADTLMQYALAKVWNSSFSELSQPVQGSKTLFTPQPYRVVWLSPPNYETGMIRLAAYTVTCGQTHAAGL